MKKTKSLRKVTDLTTNTAELEDEIIMDSIVGIRSTGNFGNNKQTFGTPQVDRRSRKKESNVIDNVLEKSLVNG